MRASVFASLLLLVATSVVDENDAASPAIAKVITMLDNLASMIEQEAETDETEHAQFMSWTASEQSATTSHVKALQTSIQNTGAALSDLRSQKSELSTTLAKVTSDLEGETSQLNSATERRNQENSEFVQEQQNFDQAINACGQAVIILKAHYGDSPGAEKELSKPKFLSLIKQAVGPVCEAAKKVRAGKAVVSAFLQKANSPGFDTYKDSGSEAGSIVDQVKELSDTFGEDKQGAIDAENGLQRAYNTLRDQKQELIGTLTSERDSQQSRLNQVTQSIAENEGALQQDTGLLGDKQTYQQTLSTQLSAAVTGYNGRKSDRDACLEAVKQAKGVLDNVSLLQTISVIKHRDSRKFVAVHTVASNTAFDRIASRARALKSLRGINGECKNCGKAAALLRTKAEMLHSSVLSTAAMTASGLGDDQINDVISSLQGLISNLDREQQSEKEHKEWCEEEISQTTQKRSGHESAVDSIQQTMNSLSELIGMKGDELVANQNDINSENQSWDDTVKLRESDKERYEEDQKGAQDAIAALNEAIGILSKFYAAKKSALIQTRKAQSLTKTSPESGSQVVEMMSSTRGEFEASAKFLRDTEATAVSAHESAREAHIKADSDLQQNRNVKTVEKQTAEQAFTSNQDDLSSNQGEITAATSYLLRLGQSCKTLIDNYDARKALRSEEKSSIKQAIEVLRDA